MVHLPRFREDTRPSQLINLSYDKPQAILYIMGLCHGLYMPSSQASSHRLHDVTTSEERQRFTSTVGAVCLTLWWGRIQGRRLFLASAQGFFETYHGSDSPASRSSRLKIGPVNYRSTPTVHILFFRSTTGMYSSSAIKQVSRIHLLVNDSICILWAVVGSFKHVCKILFARGIMTSGLILS